MKSKDSNTKILFAIGVIVYEFTSIYTQSVSSNNIFICLKGKKRKIFYDAYHFLKFMKTLQGHRHV
jgi:hypothetical protein